MDIDVKTAEIAPYYYANFLRNKIRIYSHPRSGTQYLAALIAENFILDQGDFRFLMTRNTHQLPRTNVPEDNKINIYIYRNMDDVLKSIWNFRYIIPLTTNTYDEFKSTRYCQQIATFRGNSELANKRREELKVLYKDGYHSVMNYRSLRLERDGIETGIGISPFTEETPVQYWEKHITAWKDMATRNSKVILVSYDNLKSNFQEEMNNLGLKLGIKKDKYRSIKERVGWFLKEVEDKPIG